MPVHAQFNTDNLYLKTEEAERYYTYKNLQLFPVYGTEAFTAFFEDKGTYVSLKSALAEGKIVITETPVAFEGPGQSIYDDGMLNVGRFLLYHRYDHRKF